MKKSTIALVAVVLLSFIPIAFASEKEEIRLYQVGDKGYIQYPWLENELALWPTKEMKGGGSFAGIINSQTKINVINRKGIVRENLDLLSGRLVLAYGWIKQVGRGEGSKSYFTTLNIFILPEPVH